MENYRKLYEYYKQSGELSSLFPELKFKGNWEDDKKKFVYAQQEIENLLEQDIIIEEDDNEYLY